jgi:uncharacterized DUF497 family protein
LQYKFDWDPQKASINLRRHKITFRQAATVFRDPYHLSIYDEEHSEDEERWITLGIGEAGLLLIVVHTFEQLDKDKVSIRIISARKATDTEVEQYREVNQ